MTENRLSERLFLLARSGPGILATRKMCKQVPDRGADHDRTVHRQDLYSHAGYAGREVCNSALTFRVYHLGCT